MRRLIGLLGSVALAATARAGAAQWGLSVDVGAARFAGTARDSSGASLGPYRPTTFSVRVDRELGPIRVGVGLMYDRASLVEVAPAIAIRVACFGAGVVTRVEAGPALDLWDVDDVTRTRVGARGGLGLEWPLGGRFTGSFHATGVLSGSVMNRDEAPAGVERRATRRGSVSIGLGYRL